jgi:hypothetical protein
MPVYGRQDGFSVTVSIDGRDFGVWRAREGGEGDSEEIKMRLGGMGPQVSLGGAQTMENVTVRKEFDLDGIANDVPWLMAGRGRLAATINSQPLDNDGNAHGRRVTWNGILKQVVYPEYDAEGTDPAEIELEISTDGNLA